MRTYKCLIIVSSAEWMREYASPKKSMRPCCGAYHAKKIHYIYCVFLQIMIGAELLVSFSKTFLSIFNWFLLYYYSLGTDLIALMFNRQICWRILRHWIFGTLYTHMFFMLACFLMSLFEQVVIDNPLVFIA